MVFGQKEKSGVPYASPTLSFNAFDACRMATGEGLSMKAGLV